LNEIGPKKNASNIVEVWADLGGDWPKLRLLIDFFITLENLSCHGFGEKQCF